MSYGHAQSLLVSPDDSPRQKLDKAVIKLHAWAVLNPGLMPLYKEFESAVEELPDHRGW